MTVGSKQSSIYLRGMRSEERRVGKSVDLGGRRIIKKKKKKIIVAITQRTTAP